MLEEQNVYGLESRIIDKAALQNLPALFPRHLTEGMPQDFYIYAPGSKHANLEISTRQFNGVSLGEGLFRVSIRNGFPSIQADTTQASLHTSTGSHDRELTFTKALPHPRRTCGSGGAQAYIVSEETDEIYVVSEQGPVATLNTGNGPSSCIVLGNRLFVSHLYENHLWEFNTENGQPVHKHPVGAPQKSLAISTDKQTLAMALQGTAPGVAILDLTTPQEITRIALPLTPEWIAQGPSSLSWNLSSRHQPALIHLQQEEGKWTHTIEKLSRPLTTMVASKQGTTLFAATTGYHPTAKPLHGNHYIQDQILAFDSLSLEVVGRLITHKRTERARAKGDFLKWTAGAGPSALTLLENGDLLISFSGTTEWWRVPATLSGLVSHLEINSAGLAAPHGTAELSNGLLVLTSPAEGTIGLFNPSSQHTELFQLGPEDETLSTKFPAALKRRQGEKAFYEATRSGRSCQSCHLHADSDYSAHNIGDDHLTPATLSVRGIAGTSPYLRGGAYNRVRELLHVPQELLGGYFIFDPERGEALEAFVKSLSIASTRLEPSHPASLQREQKGLLTFTKARCITCHAFPAFTDLSQHPATRIFPDFKDPALEFDTPSLIGIKNSAPYLFDGRAQTLEQVLGSEHKGTDHGLLSELSVSEKNDLIFFLESL